jgi:hypothetical protein
VTWLSSTTTLESYFDLSGLLIIDSDYTVTTTCGELGTIGFIINSEKLIELVIDCMQQFPTSGMPMLKSAVGAHGDQDIFCHTWCAGRSPSMVSLNLTIKYLI